MNDTSAGGNQHWHRNVVKGSRIWNCRNPWFRQFWEQHFKCRFNSSTTGVVDGIVVNSNSSLPECKMNDKLTYYEQEGLVPFVGKLFLFKSKDLRGKKNPLAALMETFLRILSLHAPAVTSSFYAAMLSRHIISDATCLLA